MLELSRVYVPSRRSWDPVLRSWLSTGDDAVSAADKFPWVPDRTLAIDIETPSVEDPFTIKCFTASFHGPDGIESLLLDVLRDEVHRKMAIELCGFADRIILHNAAFDVPGLFHHGILEAADINRITDTLVLARLAHPDGFTRKSLEALAVKHLGLSELSGGMNLAFKVAGFKTREAGYAGMDIGVPIYRFGAMADTAATLRLLPELEAAAIRQLTEHPFEHHGLDRAGALDRMQWVQICNRVMLRRNARGLAYDPDYLEQYAEKVAEERSNAETELSGAGIDPGNGAHLVDYLARQGVLPGNWPRTKTGKLSYAKDLFESLDHPLAAHHRNLAHAEKILGYLGTCREKAKVTGRVHAQCAVLGASATGRMSYSSPALQQFAEEARPIITDDGQGLTSIDWSQIEPVVLANAAKDLTFLEPYERGEDLYALPMRAAGIDRPTAKVVLLATMYGLGETGLAAKIGKTVEAAAQTRRQLLSAMPESTHLMSRLGEIAEAHGCIPTIAGRILPIPRDQRGRAFAHLAINYFVQGSAADVLMDAIVRAEAAGVGDCIQLPLHDELVVDTPCAEEIRRIMTEPPEFLSRWAGRVPVLRTDIASMGSKWQKV